MPQCLTDDIQLGAFLDHVRGERVPEGVDSGSGDRGIVKVFGNHVLDRPRSDALTKLGDKQPITLRSGPTHQITLDRFTDPPVEGDGSVLATLAINVHRA